MDLVDLREAVFLMNFPKWDKEPMFKVVPLGSQEYLYEVREFMTGACFDDRLELSNEQLLRVTFRDLWRASIQGIPAKLIHKEMQCVPQYVNEFGS